MRVLFIESHKFAEQVARLNAEEALWELENELLQNPDKGDLIQGTGGFRKIRMKLPGRGKSAGARVVYFHLKDRGAVFLFFLYTKSGQSDLTAEQKAALRQQASQAIFADILNVPTKTYISWESGYKNPSGAALQLLMIAKEKPEALLVT